MKKILLNANLRNFKFKFNTSFLNQNISWKIL